VTEWVEHDHLLNDHLRPDQARAARLAGVRNELCHRMTCVRDNDLLAFTHTTQQM
jgi:hypothetical protein